MLNPKRYYRTDKNLERAYRAEKGMNAYRQGEGLSEEETIGDLLTDLRHYARQHKIDFDKIVDRSLNHFEAEANDRIGDK